MRKKHEQVAGPRGGDSVARVDVIGMGAHLRPFACFCVRNTPVGDGRTVWDLLTDESIRKAVEVAERYAKGEATREELTAADDAATDAARTAADAACTAAALLHDVDDPYAYDSYAHTAAVSWQRREFNQLVSNLFNQGEK